VSLSKSPAVLLLDEDIALSSDEVRFAFAVFREFPDRLVGFAARNHLWDADRKLWRYSSKVRITKSGWSCTYLSFSSDVGVPVQFAPSSSQWGKQGPIPKEMFQSLLNNRNQGNLD
jgi:hypothetical protein